MPIRYPATSDLLGAHVSTQGGLPTAYERGVTIGANSIALFSKNSNQWAAKPLGEGDVAAFRAARAASKIGPAIAHASYLINLAAPQDELWQKSIDAMVVELERAALLGLDGVVLHPGAHVGEGIDKGIDRIARALDLVHERTPRCGVPILLETSAGQGSSLGCTFAELGRMIALVSDGARLGVCFDTCHVFAAGYDIRTQDGWNATIGEMLQHVALDRVGAFHLNDSRRELGSRVDRHEHIGKGHLGTEPFGFLLNDARFAGVPKVLETPKPTEFDADIENLTLLRSLIGRSEVKGQRSKQAGGGPKAKGQRPEQAKGRRGATGQRSTQAEAVAKGANAAAKKQPASRKPVEKKRVVRGGVARKGVGERPVAAKRVVTKKSSPKDR